MRIAITSTAQPITEREKRVVRTVIAKAIRVLGKKITGELSVAFVTPRQIKLANRAYRHKPVPTTTLSFRYSTVDGDSTGEILLCRPLIRRRARTSQSEYLSVLRELVAHSFLHLLGYTHDNSRQEARMQKAVDRIIPQQT